MLCQLPRTLIIRVLVLLSLLPLLNACTSTGRSYAATEMQETLEVEILPNTSKMFVYRLKWPENEIPNQIRIARSGSSNELRNPGGVEITKYTYRKLLENTGYVVEHMKYCREGFIELDRSMSRYHLWMKGECKEGATQDDIQKFGPKKILPVKLDS